MTIKIRDRRKFFLDLDKTLWNWNSLMDGAESLVNTLKQRDKKVYFHSDNNLLSRKQYAEKLSSMNISTTKDEVITSGYVLAKKLADNSVKKVYPVGEEGLVKEIEDKDIKISEDAETVVVGLDRQFNYETMRKAMKILQNGGKLYTTSTEATFRTGSTEKPHEKPINKALKTYAENTTFVGKPSEKFKTEFKNYFTYIPEDSVFIGDRLADIELGNKLRMKTGAAMTGDINKESLANAKEIQQPDFAFTNLERLKKKIR